MVGVGGVPKRGGGATAAGVVRSRGAGGVGGQEGPRGGGRGAGGAVRGGGALLARRHWGVEGAGHDATVLVQSLVRAHHHHTLGDAHGSDGTSRSGRVVLVGLAVALVVVLVATGH